MYDIHGNWLTYSFWFISYQLLHYHLIYVLFNNITCQFPNSVSWEFLERSFIFVFFSGWCVSHCLVAAHSSPLARYPFLPIQ